MKEIPLTRGYVAIVDDCDYEYLMQWKWHSAQSSKNRSFYARACVNGRSSTWMHRVVLELAGFDLNGYVADHINGNGLINTRANLRVATVSQNRINSGQNNRNKTGYKGIYRRSDVAKESYAAEIVFKGTRYRLGAFGTPEEAAQAYNEAAIRLFGEFAWVNVIPSTAQQSVA